MQNCPQCGVPLVVTRTYWFLGCELHEYFCTVCQVEGGLPEDFVVCGLCGKRGCTNFMRDGVAYCDFCRLMDDFEEKLEAAKRKLLSSEEQLALREKGKNGDRSRHQFAD